MYTLPRILLFLALWLLVRFPVPAVAPPPSEPDLEKARHWHRMALRAEAAGKPQAVLDALISLASVNPRGAYLPAPGDPQRKVSFHVWARQQCENVMAHASPSQRKELDNVLARQWRSASEKNDTNAMRGVIALVSVAHPLGQEARLYLAGQLGVVHYSPAADQLLQELRQGPNVESAARAVLQLAEMSQRQGLLNDALAYYRILARDYAGVRVTAGKEGAARTGADVLADLAADKRFIGLLEERRPTGKGRAVMRSSEERTTIPQKQGFTFAPLGEALPFFEQHRLTLLANKLCIWNRASQPDEVYLPLPGADFSAIATSLGLADPVRIGHEDVGHLAILNLAAQVVGVDPLGKRVLWQHDVIGRFKKWPERPTVEGDTARIDFNIGRSLRVGGTMPLTPTRLCLATRRGLTALDPLTGAVCWSRTDVSQDARLFADKVHVFVVKFKPDGKVAATAAYRLEDGAPLRIKDFSALYEKRLSIVDGRLLVWDQGAGKAPVLHLYNVAASKDDWREELPAGTVPIRSEDSAWTGTVGPKGNVQIWEVRTKKPVTSLQLPRSNAADTVKAYRLVADADTFYLATERPRAKDVVSDPQPLFSPWAGLRAIPVNGNLYAIQRTTGQLRWFNPASNQTLLVSEIERLPMVVLTARHDRLVRRNEVEPVSEIRAIGKHNGKLWYMNENVPANMYFHSIHIDQGTGKVEFLGTGLKVSMWTEAR